MVNSIALLILLSSVNAQQVRGLANAETDERRSLAGCDPIFDDCPPTTRRPATRRPATRRPGWTSHDKLSKRRQKNEQARQEEHREATSKWKCSKTKSRSYCVGEKCFCEWKNNACGCQHAGNARRWSRYHHHACDTLEGKKRRIISCGRHGWETSLRGETWNYCVPQKNIRLCGSLAARKLCIIDTIRLELNILSISDFTAVLCEFIRFN